MGFVDSAIRSLKYNGSLRRKKNYFENKEISKHNRKSEKGKRTELTTEALQRTKKHRQNKIAKSLTILSSSLTIIFYLIWKFLLS